MCSPAERAAYSRRILLAVTGLTPQVVTETVYALFRAGEPIPTEIHVLSTARGRDEARRSLFGDGPGWFGQLCRDYALPPIAFDETRLHALEDAAGKPLEDIRTREDNDRAADGITDWVRRLTRDADSELHVSLAGGRKTMGFYAGYALSLFGRPQDRLSHVLVTPPYESLAGFFYPTPRPHSIPLPKGGEADASQAEVTLADIPFLRLRHGLPDGLADAARFSEIVRTAQRALGPAEVRIDYAGRRLVAGGVAIELAPIDLAFYGWLARRALQGMGPVQRPNREERREEHDLYVDAFLAEYKRIGSEMDQRPDRTVGNFKNDGGKGMTATWFDERRARVNGKLRECLAHAAPPYLIADSGRQRGKSYWLDLKPQQILFGPATSL
jgi:CRISPR-associated protein (TIGR02584 family)